jgi:hypothetical protein
MTAARWHKAMRDIEDGTRDVNARDKSGRTLLHYAATANLRSHVLRLVELGADHWFAMPLWLLQETGAQRGRWSQNRAAWTATVAAAAALQP